MKYTPAVRKDGKSAKIGDRVLMILRKGKMFGTIVDFYKVMKFKKDDRRYQVYNVRCDDGFLAPRLSAANQRRI